MNITALIVTWNRLPQLQTTLEATLALPFQYIVIVDNASTDGTAQWLATLRDERIHIINAATNLGGAEGFYLGSQLISQQLNTDWVVFYDDDAWPAADFFERFSPLATEETALFCSKVIDCNDQLCKMNLPWKKRTATWRENLSYLRGDPSFVVSAGSTENVISCSFVGAVVNAKVLQKTYSLIHRELFIYFDDVYYGYHLYLLGYRLVYDPTLVMYHDIGNRPLGQFAPWKIYYLVRNMILAKHIFQDNSFFTWSAILFRIAKYMLSICKQPNRHRGLVLIMKAIKDGLINRRMPLDP